MPTLAHRYESPVEPAEAESGTFVAAPRVNPADARAEVGPKARPEDSRVGDETAVRLALLEALCVLARAAALLSQGGVR